MGNYWLQRPDNGPFQNCLFESTVGAPLQKIIVVPFQYSFDSTQRSFYEDLRQSGLSDRQLDRGCTSLLYTPPEIRSAYFSSNALDVIESCELFRALTDTPQAAGMDRIYRRWAGESFPWRISSTRILENFYAALRHWRQTHPGVSSQSLELVRFIYDWVFGSEGLGMSYAPGSADTADSAISRQRGDCTELAFIYLTLLWRAGFSPTPFWVGMDNRGDRFLHVVAGLQINGQTYLLDPAYDPARNRQLRPQSDYDPLLPGHLSFSPISFRELLAWYWNDVGSHWGERGRRAMGYIQRQAFFQGGIRSLTRALQIDPYNPWIWANRGVLNRYQDDPAMAQADFERALSLQSDNPQALAGRGDLHFQRGEYGPAEPFYRRALQADPPQQIYREYLIRTLIYLGRLSEASEEWGSFPATHPHYPELRQLLDAHYSSE